MDNNACPVCGAKTEVFLDRQQVPVHQHTLMEDQESAVRIARGDLELACCPACGFDFNRAFDAAKLEYGRSYENTQECSPCFESYVAVLARRLVHESDVRNSHIVEVGCGTGSFLRLLVGEEGSGNRGTGFDPAYRGPAEELGGRLKFQARLYGPECGESADVVISRHVIEHVGDPVGLLRTIRAALAHSPQARLFLETPCVEWILRNRVFWDFFYEHCSYFSTMSLTTALEEAGFAVVAARHEFEGQYLWLEARVSGPSGAAAHRQAGQVPQLAREFAAAEGGLQKALVARLEKLAGGAVAIWGAGAKGATLANLVDADRRRIACVIDLNPNKQGRFLPGTGHPIIDCVDLPRYGVTTAVLMNPNYRAECLAILKRLQLSVRLVDLAEKGGTSMKLTIDTEQQTVVEESGGTVRTLPLYSAEAFKLLSAQWVNVGWNQKYAYGFSWLGRPIIQLPEDLIRIQEVIWEVKPDVIIETGVAHGGSLIFYASLCKAMERGRVIGIDIEIRPHNRKAIEAHPLFPFITLIEGSSIDPGIVGQARKLVRPGERVLALLDSCHTKAHVLAELAAYAPLVTVGSYIVATDGIMGQVAGVPRAQADWTWNNPEEAAREFVAKNSAFALVEPTFPFNEGAISERITHWPHGFIKRMA
jgi:cephalosporin hydroxylase/SAM-dependent methyltransferase